VADKPSEQAGLIIVSNNNTSLLMFVRNQKSNSKSLAKSHSPNSHLAKIFSPYFGRFHKLAKSDFGT
jgi:hypothetical protein